MISLVPSPGLFDTQTAIFISGLLASGITMISMWMIAEWVWERRDHRRGSRRGSATKSKSQA